ncbi:MAG: HNH endonuclease [Candidatus Magasanikiibacteriota bacterium]
MITQSQLKELLSYDPYTGYFMWLIPGSGRPKGRPAGGPSDRGYIQIPIEGKKYYAHRLAVLYMTGSFPLDVVDHVDRNPRNNSWSNLRPCTQQQNCWNKTQSTSGTKGVSFNTAARKWKVQLTIEHKYTYLGLYETLEQAQTVVETARKLHHKEFAKH